jgi:hypothetical protein
LLTLLKETTSGNSYGRLFEVTKWKLLHVHQSLP